MSAAPVPYGLVLAAMLFALGALGVLIRRNVVFMLMSTEIMLNAAGVAFVTAGARWAEPSGQIMFILVLTLAAAEVSVGLALILQLVHRLQSLDADRAMRMRG